MSVHYQRDDQRCLITVTLRDVCAAPEMVTTIHQQAAEGTWHYATLVDARACAPPSPSDLWQIQKAVESYRARLGARGPVALTVSAESDVAYGMGRMYELRANDPSFSVFRRLDEAERWLGVQHVRVIHAAAGVTCGW